MYNYCFLDNGINDNIGLAIFTVYFVVKKCFMLALCLNTTSPENNVLRQCSQVFLQALLSELQLQLHGL